MFVLNNFHYYTFEGRIFFPHTASMLNKPFSLRNIYFCSLLKLNTNFYNYKVIEFRCHHGIEYLKIRKFRSQRIEKLVENDILVCTNKIIRPTNVHRLRSYYIKVFFKKKAIIDIATVFQSYSSFLYYHPQIYF